MIIFNRKCKLVISLVVFAFFYLGSIFTLECAVENLKGAHFKFEEAIIKEDPEVIKLLKVSPYKCKK